MPSKRAHALTEFPLSDNAVVVAVGHHDGARHGDRGRGLVLLCSMDKSPEFAVTLAKRKCSNECEKPFSAWTSECSGA